jgi:subfamily B ATP-binding cassette protein MsbA
VTSKTTFADDFRLYRRLLGFAWKYKWAFPIALLGMVLMGATAAGVSSVMKPLVDEGFVQRNPEIIRQAPLWIILFAFARGLASFLGEYTTSWIGRRVIYDLRNACFARLLRLPNGFFDLHAPGRLIAKLIYDVEQIAGAVTQGLITVIGDGLTTVFLFGFLFYSNWKLTLFLFIVAPFSMLLVRAMSKGFRRTSQKIQHSVGDISRIAQEATEGHRLIKAFGGADYEQTRFAEASRTNRRQALRKTAISVAGMGVVQFVGSFGFAFMMYMALSDAGMSAGLFVSYVVATTWLMGPMRRLAKVNEVLQTALAAAASAFELLDEPAEQDDGGKAIERVGGRVEYRNVSYRYASAQTDAVKNVSFTIEPGQTVALVGASGSGKTTLASLLPRFYRVSGGTVLLDDININELTLANLRSHIALVGQETLLFDDTLANNIAYGSATSIDRDRLVDAARTAHVLEFAERLAHGLDTRVGEKGGMLSGGQRQRVAIARALYKNAPILILDEATSALDTESERLVQDAMRRLLANRTTLVIAHRLSTIEHADRIVVLSRGEIVETGTHQQLLARDGAYANLYRMQFADVD